MIDGLDVWDSLTEEERRAVLAALQGAAQARAHADRDLYASNFSGDASTVDICVAWREDGWVVLAYVFDSWQWCPAQSGSDWNYHSVYRGEAVTANGVVRDNTIERVRHEYIHESQEGAYDRAHAVQQVRAELARPR